jgi:hypothetical protein
MPTERAIPEESNKSRERARRAEIAISSERAKTQESTRPTERAAQLESTIPNERANLAESAKSHERAAHPESTMPNERAIGAESTIMIEQNPFEALAAEQMARVTKQRLEASRKRAEKRLVVQSEKDAPMKLGPMEQKLENSSKQMSGYKVIKRAEFDAMKHHPLLFSEWNEYTARVLDLSPDNADAFVGYIAKAAWLHEAELSIRRLALSFIANRLMNMRLEQGLAPLDDALPGEPDNLFITVRTLLRVLT